MAERQITSLDDFRNAHQETCGGREQELRFAQVRCTDPACPTRSAHYHGPAPRMHEHLFVCTEGCGFHYTTDSSD